MCVCISLSLYLSFSLCVGGGGVFSVADTTYYALHHLLPSTTRTSFHDTLPVSSRERLLSRMQCKWYSLMAGCDVSRNNACVTAFRNRILGSTICNKTDVYAIDALGIDYTPHGRADISTRLSNNAITHHMELRGTIYRFYSNR